jgi:hypothetical protein
MPNPSPINQTPIPVTRCRLPCSVVLYPISVFYSPAPYLTTVAIVHVIAQSLLSQYLGRPTNIKLPCQPNDQTSHSRHHSKTPPIIQLTPTLNQQPLLTFVSMIFRIDQTLVSQSLSLLRLTPWARHPVFASHVVLVRQPCIFTLAATHHVIR